MHSLTKLRDKLLRLFIWFLMDLNSKQQQKYNQVQSSGFAWRRTELGLQSYCSICFQSDDQGLGRVRFDLELCCLEQTGFEWGQHQSHFRGFPVCLGKLINLKTIMFSNNIERVEHEASPRENANQA